MNTTSSFDAYRSHDLNIAMRTSSGDVIKMDFANEQSSSMKYSQNENGTSSSMSFSSMQSFQFSIESNGIDAQDKKEIEAFMKIAQPFIDDFLKELEDTAPKSPVTQVAQKIAEIFEPTRERNNNEKNHVKSQIVTMFDDSMNKLKQSEKIDTQNMLKDIFTDAQTLLEKTLQEFDEFNKSLYA